MVTPQDSEDAQFFSQMEQGAEEARGQSHTILEGDDFDNIDSDQHNAEAWRDKIEKSDDSSEKKH